MKKVRENLLRLIRLLLFFLKAIKCNSCDGTGIYKGVGEDENVGVVCFSCDGSGKVEKRRNLPKDIDLTEFFWQKIRRYDVDKVFIPIMGCIHSKLTKGGVLYIDWFENNSPPMLSESYCPFAYFGDEDNFSCDLKKERERNFIICAKFKDEESRKGCWKEFINNQSNVHSIPFNYLLPSLNS